MNESINAEQRWRKLGANLRLAGFDEEEAKPTEPEKAPVAVGKLLEFMPLNVEKVLNTSPPGHCWC